MVRHSAAAKSETQLLVGLLGRSTPETHAPLRAPITSHIRRTDKKKGGVRGLFLLLFFLCVPPTGFEPVLPP